MHQQTKQQQKRRKIKEQKENYEEKEILLPVQQWDSGFAALQVLFKPNVLNPAAFRKGKLFVSNWVSFSRLVHYFLQA